MKPVTFAYESMGTHWEVSIWDEIEALVYTEIEEQVIAASDKFDNTYSRFKSDSLISQLATKTGKVEVPHELVMMLKWYQRLNKLSLGKVTPLVGTTLEDMGYDREYSLKEKGSIHPIPDFDRAVSILNDDTIELHSPSLLDLGALGKGYFVDHIKTMLSDKQISHFLVNGSGDIYYSGQEKPIVVGLEHPQDPKKVIGAVKMKKGAMCSSGSNRRAWGKYHHIIDPESLSSTTEIIASWVISDSATVADALATALFLSPAESFSSEFKFEYLLLNKAMKVKLSEGFEVELF